jgi:hypothetical protein
VAARFHRAHDNDDQEQQRNEAGYAIKDAHGNGGGVPFIILALHWNAGDIWIPGDAGPQDPSASHRVVHRIGRLLRVPLV